MIHHAKAEDFLPNYRGQADLVFMDPPFNIGESYGQCDDKLPDETYAAQLREWIYAGVDALSKRGSLWLNLPDRWAATAVINAEILELIMENWCIWHFRFAQCQPNRFLRSKTHALWFSRGDPIVNREAALVPSLRASLYDDSRSIDGERMDFDVWGFEPYWGRVQGNNAERRPLHPNQLPEAYLQRVIGVCSDPGSLVIDPFSGSGTTHAVATAMGRNCEACDIDPDYVKSGNERRAVRC